jgi:YbbR domain-containing protein
MLRWLRENLGSPVLALVMAVMVWASAVNAADPAQERLFPAPIDIDISALSSDLVIVGQAATQGQVTVRAPRSVWDQLTSQDIHLEADLGNLGAGQHQVTLTSRVDLRPARVTSVEPRNLVLTLELVAARNVPVQVRTLGTPAVGYQVETPTVTPDQATVIGPASAVLQVAQVLAEINLTGQRQDLTQTVRLLPVDPSGQSVAGVRVDPETASVVAPVEQMGGYRDVAVKVVIEGQVEPGYWVTRITVSPPILTVYSADAEAVVILPGFVETEPLVLTGASSDIEVRLGLDLPEGVSPVGEQTVLVQVGVAAIESSLTITRSLDIQGLGHGLYATPSPDTVSVILTGPLPVLERLSLEDVRVILDLLDLGIGTHQVTPQVIVLPSGVTAQAVLPATVEVTITTRPPAAVTPTP